MAKKDNFRVGVLEVGGIGLTAGVLLGSMSTLAGGTFDAVVPCAAALGAVGLPAFWFGVGVPLRRLLYRPRTTRVPSARGLTA